MASIGPVVAALVRSESWSIVDLEISRNILKMASGPNLSIGRMAVLFLRGLLARKSRFGDFARAIVDGIGRREFRSVGQGTATGTCYRFLSRGGVCFLRRFCFTWRTHVEVSVALMSSEFCLWCKSCVNFLHLGQCSDLSRGCRDGELSAAQLEVVGRFAENSKLLLDRAPADGESETGELDDEKLLGQHSTGYDGCVMSKPQPLTLLEVLWGLPPIVSVGIVDPLKLASPELCRRAVRTELRGVHKEVPMRPAVVHSSGISGNRSVTSCDDVLHRNWSTCPLVVEKSTSTTSTSRSSQALENLGILPRDAPRGVWWTAWQVVPCRVFGKCWAICRWHRGFWGDGGLGSCGSKRQEADGFDFPHSRQCSSVLDQVWRTCRGGCPASVHGHVCRGLPVCVLHERVRAWGVDVVVDQARACSSRHVVDLRGADVRIDSGEMRGVAVRVIQLAGSGWPSWGTAGTYWCVSVEEELAATCCHPGRQVGGAGSGGKGLQL